MSGIGLTVLGACGLLIAGCGAKDHAATATTTTVSLADGAGVGDNRPRSASPPFAREAPAARADDRAQTAAVSPPSNFKGTLPASPGVDPPAAPEAVAPH